MWTHKCAQRSTAKQKHILAKSFLQNKPYDLQQVLTKIDSPENELRNYFLIDKPKEIITKIEEVTGTTLVPKLHNLFERNWLYDYSTSLNIVDKSDIAWQKDCKQLIWKLAKLSQTEIQFGSQIINVHPVCNRQTKGSRTSAYTQNSRLSTKRRNFDLFKPY